MSMTLTPEEIRRLPVAERLELIEELWSSLVEAPEGLGVSEAQRAELERRLQEFARDPRAGKSWEDLKRSLGA
jgi:putative addiction module component (TIGR02574 family)